MNSSVGFGIAGAACIGAAIILAFSNSASGDTVMTVNGVDIDSSVLELYIESRMQRPAEQVSPEERASMLEELQDIYLLTTQPRADELSNEAAVAAQIELQKRGILAQVVATDFIEKNQGGRFHPPGHFGDVPHMSRKRRQVCGDRLMIPDICEDLPIDR